MKTVGVVANPTKEGVSEAIEAVRAWSAEHGLEIIADDVLSDFAPDSVRCAPVTDRASPDSGAPADPSASSRSS